MDVREAKPQLVDDELKLKERRIGWFVMQRCNGDGKLLHEIDRAFQYRFRCIEVGRIEMERNQQPCDKKSLICIFLALRVSEYTQAVLDAAATIALRFVGALWSSESIDGQRSQSWGIGQASQSRSQDTPYVH